MSLTGFKLSAGAAREKTENGQQALNQQWVVSVEAGIKSQAAQGYHHYDIPICFPIELVTQGYKQETITNLLKDLKANGYEVKDHPKDPKNQWRILW